MSMYTTQTPPTPTRTPNTHIGLNDLLNPVRSATQHSPVSLPPLNSHSDDSPHHTVLPGFASFDNRLDRSQVPYARRSPVPAHPERTDSRFDPAFYTDGHKSYGERGAYRVAKGELESAYDEPGTYEARARDEYRPRPFGGALATLSLTQFRSNAFSAINDDLLRGDWTRVDARPDSPSIAYGPGPSPALDTRHGQHPFPPPSQLLSMSHHEGRHPRVSPSSSAADRIVYQPIAGPVHPRPVPSSSDTAAYSHQDPRQTYSAAAHQPPSPSPRLPHYSGSFVHPPMPPLGHVHPHRPLYSHHSPHSFQTHVSTSSATFRQGNSQDGWYPCLVSLPFL